MTRLVLLDFETTGLDPTSDEILEVGALLVDNELRIESSYHSLVYPPRLPITVMTNRAVFDMHKKSGLTDELMKFWSSGERRRVEDVEHALLAWLTSHDCAPGDVELTGFSIHFDRSFIAERMPDLHKFLSHRMLNVSSFRTAFKLWSGEEPPKQDGTHRALPDCHEALKELAFYRSRFFPTRTALKSTVGQELADALEGATRETRASILQAILERVK